MHCEGIDTINTEGGPRHSRRGRYDEEVMFRVIDSFNETHLKMRRILRTWTYRSGNQVKLNLLAG